MFDLQEGIKKLLTKAGITGDMVLTSPPSTDMGDFAFGCFVLAKEQKKNPAAVAKEISDTISGSLGKNGFVERVTAAGPYVNFFINPVYLAETVLPQIDASYGSLTIGKKKKYLIEFGCPNPLKAFHLGHLKNLVTGESVARIFENAGYKVVRINYQGDVGMHIAKAMWGIEQTLLPKMKELASASLLERLKALGAAYAFGAKAFEEDETKKAEIVVMNKRVYKKDPAIQEIYRLAVAWSLEYFDTIYTQLGTQYDRLYMESEVTDPGEHLVRENLKKGIFKESQGAIIFEGSKYGLHDRVFINSEGFPTYEAKDLGLAEAHFTDHNPDRVVHIVGKEQTEYFKVVFTAMSQIWPDRASKEFHLPGGFLQLKEGKMSSRTGNVVLAEDLLNQAKEAVAEIMKDRELGNKETVIEKVAIAAVKYAILKVNVSDDVAFDLKTSVNIDGDSGPYLLYIVARINSILKKATDKVDKKIKIPEVITPTEKQLVLTLAKFPTITTDAAENLDPSLVAHYVLELAQTFNTFYHDCPVLQTDDVVIRAFRLHLIERVAQVMTSGLALLGIETVEEM